jgi:hypothetical protein
VLKIGQEKGGFLSFAEQRNEIAAKAAKEQQRKIKTYKLH